jgi:hypothetical protein
VEARLFGGQLVQVNSPMRDASARRVLVLFVVLFWFMGRSRFLEVRLPSVETFATRLQGQKGSQ